MVALIHHATTYVAGTLGLLAVLECARATQVSLRSSLALTENWRRGTPILGFDTGCSKAKSTCDWMAKLPDHTKITSLNLPGTHDAATWNYTAATQQALLNYTGPNIPPSTWFRTQSRSLFQQLNDGIRVFDLRFAYNPGNVEIGFYHSQALLAPNTTIEEVFSGIYSWLDRHPSETLLLSLNHEGGTGTPNDANLYQHMWNLLQQPIAKKYWIQEKGVLGSLGSTRGKIILLQRFEYTLIGTPDDPSPNPFGLLLPPGQWTDNGPDIKITYPIGTKGKTGTAFVEDFYEPHFDNATLDIQAKAAATIEHLHNATIAKEDVNELWITFASAEETGAASGAVTPEDMAVGNSSLGVQGVNQALIPWLKARKGKRFGIVMLDFYDRSPGLVEAIIGH